MWQEIFQVALSNGIFAALFVGLLFYQLKDSSIREKKYQKTIEKLSNHLGLVEDINNDVKEIKQFVFTKKRKGDKNNENAA